MKKLFYLIAIVFLIGCEKAPTYEELAIEKVKEILLDPNSFELIKTERDTTRMSDGYQTLIDLNTDLADEASKNANDELDRAEMYVGVNLKKAKEIARKSQRYIDEAKEYINEAKEFDSIRKSIVGTDSDSIMSINFLVRGYAMARGGNKTIGDWKVRYDKNYEFLELVDIE